MNSRAKGRRSENKAVAELQKQGYEIYQVPGTRIFNRQCDMFNLWDILALKDCGKLTNILFVQVKTNKKPSTKDFQKYIDFTNKYNKTDSKTSISGEIWVYRDRKNCRKFRVVNNDMIEVIDSRKEVL